MRKNSFNDHYKIWYFFSEITSISIKCQKPSMSPNPQPLKNHHYIFSCLHSHLNSNFPSFRKRKKFVKILTPSFHMIKLERDWTFELKILKILQIQIIINCEVDVHSFKQNTHYMWLLFWKFDKKLRKIYANINNYNEFLYIFLRYRNLENIKESIMFL